MPPVLRKPDGAVPTAEQLHALADAAPPRLSAYVPTGVGTGFRPGELLGLTLPRVDFLRRVARVERQLVYVSGRPPYLGPPKTLPDGEREVPLPDFVLEALSAHLAAWPPYNVHIWDEVEAKYVEAALIFQADKGGPILRTTFNGRWRLLVRRAGLPDIVPHSLRHAYASYLNQGGVPFTTIQELLGHKRQGTTWAVYTHRTQGWDRQVRDALTAMWREDGADCVRTDSAHRAFDLRR